MRSVGYPSKSGRRLQASARRHQAPLWQQQVFMCVIILHITSSINPEHGYRRLFLPAKTLTCRGCSHRFQKQREPSGEGAQHLEPESHHGSRVGNRRLQTSAVHGALLPPQQALAAQAPGSRTELWTRTGKSGPWSVSPSTGSLGRLWTSAKRESRTSS